MVEKQNKKFQGITFLIFLILTGVGSTSLLSPIVESTYTYDLNLFSNYDKLFILNDRNALNKIPYPYSTDYWQMQTNRVILLPDIIIESSIGEDGINISSNRISYLSTNTQVNRVEKPIINKIDGMFYYVSSG